jgi:hypothetical protein
LEREKRDIKRKIIERNLGIKRVKYCNYKKGEKMALGGGTGGGVGFSFR